MSRGRRALGLWLPVAAFMLLVWMVSARPAEALPQTRHDKLVHVAAYALLGFLALRACHGGSTAPRALPSACAVALTAGYGALDELHQAWVPGRHASVADWIADALGALLALGLLRAVRRAPRRAARATESGGGA